MKFKGIVYLVCLQLLAVSMPGCFLFNKGEEEEGTSMEVGPSTADQIVIYGGLTVTVPGGVLNSAGTLSAGPSSRTLSDEVGDEVDLLGVFDVTLTAGADGDITMELGYDPAKLDSDLPEELGFGVSYWHEERSVWVTVPCQVDLVSKKVVVKTPHLSTWAFWRLVNRYSYLVTDEKNFNVYYKPTAHAPVLDTVSGSTMEQLARDVGKYAEKAYKAYAEAGFKVPTTYVTRINVVLTHRSLEDLLSPVTDARWSGITGWIYLPVKELSTTEQVSHDTGHEVFHYVQNQYFSVFADVLWLIEGTADYASAVVGWNRTNTIPHFDEDPYRFLTPFFTPEKSADLYLNSRFIQWLVDDHGGDFKELWDFVAENSSIAADTKRLAFEKYVFTLTDKDFEQAYADYIVYTIFDSACPWSSTAKMLDAGSTQPRKLGLVDNNGDEILEVKLSFPLQAGHTVRLWKIMSQALAPETTRTLEVSAESVPDNSHVELWRLSGDVPENRKLVAVLNSLNLKYSGAVLGDTDALIAVMFNDSQSPQTITLTARDENATTPPPPPPDYITVTSVDRTKGYVGIGVTVHGTGFSWGPSNNQVQVGGLDASITVNSETYLDIVIPESLSAGTHEVCVRRRVDASAAFGPFVCGPTYETDGRGTSYSNSWSGWTWGDITYDLSFTLTATGGGDFLLPPQGLVGAKILTFFIPNPMAGESHVYTLNAVATNLTASDGKPRRVAGVNWSKGTTLTANPAPLEVTVNTKINTTVWPELVCWIAIEKEETAGNWIAAEIIKHLHIRFWDDTYRTSTLPPP